MAHDLHDTVGQLITGAGIMLAERASSATDEDRRALRPLIALLARADQELRQAVEGLIQTNADGCVSEIQSLCAEFELRTGVVARFDVFGPVEALPPDTDEAVVRVAREALANVARHARASMVSVQLRYAASSVSLSIQDDGVGLGSAGSSSKRGHFGVRGMRRRVEALGGRLRITEVDPSGVLVQAVIPGRGTAHDHGPRGGRG